MSRETFERGILYAVSLHGWTPERIGAVLNKQGNLLDSAYNIAGAAGKGIGLGADATLATAAGIPILAGTIGGAAAYGMSRPDYDDVLAQSQRKQLLRELTLKTRLAKMKARQNGTEIAVPPAVT
jgi:hypothetical protein